MKERAFKVLRSTIAKVSNTSQEKKKPKKTRLNAGNYRGEGEWGGFIKRNLGSYGRTMSLEE